MSNLSDRRPFFYHEEHQAIYEATLTLWERNQGGALDGLLVRSELSKSRALTNALADVGGLDYLKQVIETVPSSTNVEYYSRLMLEAHRYRQAVAVGAELESLLTDGTGTDEPVQRAQELMLGLDTGETEPKHFTLADHAAKQAVAMFDKPEAIPTGYRDLDRLIGGLTPGHLDILAARPSMGKSALALDIALNAANGHGGRGPACRITLESQSRVSFTAQSDLPDQLESHVGFPGLLSDRVRA